MAEIPPTSDSHRLTTKVNGGVHAIPFLHSIDCGGSPQSIVAGMGSGAWYHPTQRHNSTEKYPLQSTREEPKVYLDGVPELNSRIMSLSYYMK